MISCGLLLANHTKLGMEMVVPVDFRGVLWALLVGVGILSTFGPSPASIEGMIYTVLPFDEHIRGYPEILLQSLLLSVIVVYWVNHPEKRWISWVLGILFGLMMLLLTMGLLMG